ncbi:MULTISPECIES: PQQ-binding-like beta-propeller repeat protein [Haloferax]|uniref:PQQ-binding-like beta-propeller repeat protein n=1 Tax=Haloferax marinum TaxID=2666143 RepID=A0A6A8G726_9EURY|nr:MULTISPECIES: PQQ-binding-like beta-propeller repeat protein [Haloferax]KAB1197292.1 PQQ-binding-like beta-propeller repeat protein [Haloferax sp. CBA1150]MRW96332.1 PQQ-binding-like beta-propeller repeat protein [Haloferax marinum]
MSGLTRRQFLAAVGTAGFTSSAGCVSGGDQPTYAGEWSRRGFDDARTGFTPANGPTGNLTTAWRASVFEAYPTSSPVVSDGRVYYLHTRGGHDVEHESVVSAFAAATGEELWRTTISVTTTDQPVYHHDSLAVAGTSRAPAAHRTALDDVADDRLYARTFEELHALTTDGELLWSHPVPTTEQSYPVVAPVVVSDGVAVTATFGDRTPPSYVVGVDAESGRPRWTAGFNAHKVPWTLSAADGTAYVPFLGGDAGLVALDIETGRRAWELSLPADGPVTVAGETMLVPLDGDPESILAIDRRTQETRWQFPAGRRTESGVAVAGELVYYCADRMVVARRLDTGELVWSFGPTPAVSLSWTPVVAGTTVYVVAERQNEDGSPNYLYALDATTGTVRGSGRVGGSPDTGGLAVVDGAAYLALGRGELLCFESCGPSVAGRCLGR